MKFKKIFSTATVALATLAVMATNTFSAPNSAVNWNKNVITVTGSGYAPSGHYAPSQAQKLAERAAIADAQRQLAEIVNGVKVTGETNVQELKLISDIVRVKVEAVVKGAKKISSRDTGDGGVEVTMQMPLFGGADSLASSVIERPTAKIPFPTPKSNVAPTRPNYTSSTPVKQRIDIVVQSTSPNTSVTVQRNPLSSNLTGFSDWQKNVYSANGFVLTPMAQVNIPALPHEQSESILPQMPTQQSSLPQAPQENSSPIPQVQQESTLPIPEVENLSSDAETIGGYTGIIVDCSGLNLQPVMSPVIKNEDGETIYGNKNLDYDKVIELGMASYSNGEENLERAGKNPIVVKAVEVSNFNSNPVLSIEDSNRVLIENQSDKFLDKLNVVFVDEAMY